MGERLGWRPAAAPGRRAVLTLAAVALVARLAAAVALRAWDIPAGDGHFAFGWEIGRIAAALARGEGFVSPYGSGRPSAWMPPVYPYLLAGVFSLCGVYSKASAVVMLALQATIAAATVPVIVALGGRWFGARAGLAAAAAFALHPAAIYLAGGMIWSSALTALLAVSALLAAAVHAAGGSLRSALAGGLLLGLLGLVDPVCLVLLASLLWAVARAPGAAPGRLRAAAAVCAASAVVVAPSIIRNVRVFGEPVFLKSNFGQELWLGNNDHASGMWLAADGSNMYGHLPADDLRHVQTLSEPAISRWYRARATSWMRDHPGRVAALTLHRMRLFWWEAEFASVRAKAARAGGTRATRMLTLALRLTVVLGLAGALLAVVRRRPVVPALLFLALYPAAYYVTHMSSYRYRHPVEPVLLLLAAGGAFPSDRGARGREPRS